MGWWHTWALSWQGVRGRFLLYALREQSRIGIAMRSYRTPEFKSGDRFYIIMCDENSHRTQLLTIRKNLDKGSELTLTTSVDYTVRLEPSNSKARRRCMYPSGVQTVGGGSSGLIDQRWRNMWTSTYVLHCCLRLCRRCWCWWCWRTRELTSSHLREPRMVISSPFCQLSYTFPVLQCSFMFLHMLLMVSSTHILPSVVLPHQRIIIAKNRQ